MKIFSKAEKYDAEFENYKDAGEDFFEYAAQECEEMQENILKKQCMNTIIE